MHTVAMRTEATMPEEEAPANLGRAFKVTAFITKYTIWEMAIVHSVKIACVGVPPVRKNR